MASRLAVHWQKTHPDDHRDRAIFARWKPRSVKIITVGNDVKGIELVPQESVCVIRHHPLSEDRGLRDAAEAKEKGQRHGDFCKTLAEWVRANDPQRDWGRLVFTGLNEPEVWPGGREPAELVGRYYAEFARRLHQHGLRCGLLNFSVGWPGNHGPDLPPDWKPFEAVLGAYLEGDYLIVHEYWDRRGPQHNWRWWAGRYLQCPWSLPIIIGECGVDQYVSDSSVEKEQRGWRSWLNVQQYMEQLAWYDKELQKDRRIHSAQVFTYDFSHPWASFNIREDDLMGVFLPYVESQQGTVEPPPNSLYKDIVNDLPKHPTLRYEKRPQPITAIAIHHTAGPVTGEWATAERIAQMHVEDNGWPGIGYHFFVTPDGTIYQTNPLDTMSYHVAGDNAYSIGVCFAGDFTKQPPTAAQTEAGRKLLSHLLGLLNLKPNAVMGHKDFPGETTACPGNKPKEKWWKDMLTVVPEPPPVTDARWQAEESVRQIEASIASLSAARERLLTVITFLRQQEGV